jgi:hypothetical protein
MSRRLGVLAVLLLCLAGFAPSIWACAAMEQHRDCCPPGQPPCDTGKAPLSTGMTAAACCSAQLAAAQPAASLSVEKEHVLSGSPPTGGWQGISTVADATRAYSIRSPKYSHFLARNNQQQLYLQTGRLRL